MKPLYIFANWKMYLDHAESVALARALNKKVPTLKLSAEMAVFPSSLSFLAVQKELKGKKIVVGSQNVYWLDKGGYTGEVSAQMYKQVKASYALVGHSERRHLFHERNSEVRQKLDAILTADLKPVLCVGETLEERKDEEVEVVIEAQLRAALTDLSWNKKFPLIIAYEPVWAISTGESCDPDEAERVAALIHKYVKGLLGKNTELIVVYGGSVRADNVSNYIAQPHINGVLVGGASTKLSTWMDILKEIKA